MSCDNRSELGKCAVLNGEHCEMGFTNNCLHGFRADCKKMKNLIEEGVEEIENCYGKETDLTERLRDCL